MSAVLGVATGLTAHPEELPDLELAWLEGHAEVCFVRSDEADDWRDLERWPEGRLFGEAGEYRWRWANGSLHAVLLLDGGQLPEPFQPRVELERAGESLRYLYGEWVNDEEEPEANPEGGPLFYAREIPAIQTYPVDLGDRPHANKVTALTVRSYRSGTEDLGVFLRCVRLTVWRGQEGAHG